MLANKVSFVAGILLTLAVLTTITLVLIIFNWCDSTVLMQSLIALVFLNNLFWLFGVWALVYVYGSRCGE